MAFRVLNNLAPSSLTFFLSHVTCKPGFFKSVLQHTSGCVTPSCSLRRNVLLGPDLPFSPDCEQMRAGMMSYFYLQHLTEVAKCKCLEIVCWVILNRNLPNMLCTLLNKVFLTILTIFGELHCFFLERLLDHNLITLGIVERVLGLESFCSRPGKDREAFSEGTFV